MRTLAFADHFTRTGIGAVLPGLAAVGLIALAARILHSAVGVAALSPLLLAMMIGMALRNSFGIAPSFAPGIRFTLRRLLRAAVVLLGLQVSMGSILDIGGGVIAAVVITLALTFVFTRLVGHWMGVGSELTTLIAAGTSICGASAVMGANTVLRARDEDVAYAIACVSLFGAVGMVLLPMIGSALALSGQLQGLWIGTSLHEVAQVVGAGFSVGPEAGQAAMVAKLTRVLMLAPVILLIGQFIATKGGGDAKAPLPWFAFGFVALAIVNPHLGLSDDLRAHFATICSVFMAMALAALGLEADLKRLWLKGLRPLALGAMATLFVAVTGLGLLLALGLQ